MLTVTYVVVIFSIIVQGLTIGRMIRWLYPRQAAPDSVALGSIAAE